ncbi:helix-turn-helix domain-containing protein [Pseudolysobacter antarcticus]|uniref:Helix-turn-helix domain-containing protein n=1 Tax=Pseudolysobacter antarcticus TaxID=2511995 RepID=A0A411HEX4_9GAMM|nr:helix-turn-helix domain-containing protein [Pseudolysobacter antarcticus]QBB69040.1 helix-turn-helix domain-containing protein [Pseudolysobacter antarcticus]
MEIVAPFGGVLPPRCAHHARLSCHFQRMQHAAKLLTAWPRLAFDTIAERCGYGDPAGFHKAFRRHVGMTPRDWRAAQSAASGGII